MIQAYTILELHRQVHLPVTVIKGMHDDFFVKRTTPQSITQSKDCLMTSKMVLIRPSHTCKPKFCQLSYHVKREQQKDFHFGHNKALYFGKSIDYLLIHLNLTRAFDILMSNNPPDERKDFEIDHSLFIFLLKLLFILRHMFHLMMNWIPASILL